MDRNQVARQARLARTGHTSGHTTQTAGSVGIDSPTEGLFLTLPGSILPLSGPSTSVDSTIDGPPPVTDREKPSADYRMPDLPRHASCRHLFEL